MISPKFAWRKIKSVNYKEMYESIRRVSKKTKRPFVLVAADFCSCILKHECGYIDYEDLEMYDMTEEERAKVLTIGRNLKLCHRLNSDKDRHLIENKVSFNNYFNDYLGREWFYAEDPENGTLEDFKKFLQGKDRVMLKPADLGCGEGIEMCNTTDYTPEELYEKSKRDGAPLVEEVVVQSSKMDELAPYTVNTIRIVSILSGKEVKIIGAGIRMGREGSIVDNFSQGGINARVDPRDGTIVTDGFDKYGQTHITVPGTGAKIKGKKVPFWEDVINMVSAAHLRIPTMRYVGWDVAIDHNDRPLFIEANDYAGNFVAQMPKLGIGTYAAIKEALGEPL